MQEFVDRRFFRKKYDAEITLSNFASIIRNEVDIIKISSELLGAVDENLQPDYVSLWMNKEVGQR